MNTGKEKSGARKTLEKARGGEMTFGRMVESIRRCDEISQANCYRTTKRTGVAARGRVTGREWSLHPP